MAVTGADVIAVDPVLFENDVFLINSLLSGSFLIKFSPLSAPTKIEELTAGSDEKTQRSPAGNRTQGIANSSRTPMWVRSSVVRPCD